MKLNLSAHFILMNDIDASETRYWNNESGFEPIGSSDFPFNGSLDGAGHVISDLWINRGGIYDVGIFSSLMSARISNLSINMAMVSGDYSVGIMAGSAEDTRIENCSVSGRISNTIGSTGGLLGYGIGEGLEVTDCTSNVQIDISGSHDFTYIGGLIGYKGSGKVKDCTFLGDIKINGSGYSDIRNIGGLIGQNYGPVMNSRSIGSIAISRWDNVESLGGFIGSNFGQIDDCASLSDVNLGADINITQERTCKNIGGLIGYNRMNVTQSKWEGTINIFHNTSDPFNIYYTGGLLGYNLGPITTCTSHGNLEITGIVYYMGGFAGVNFGSVMNSSSTTSILITSQGYTNSIGGFIGYHGQAIILDCISTGIIEINAQDGTASMTGGLVGYLNSGSIYRSNSGSEVYINGPGSVSYAGGLVGLSYYGDIDNSFSTGNIQVSISSSQAIDIGGLVGNNNLGTITDGHSTGNIIITGIGSVMKIGGLIGANYRAVDHVYSTGSIEISVTPIAADCIQSIGGLIGYNHHYEVEWAYSEGDIIFDLQGPASNNTLCSVGGLIGENNGGFISKSYSKGNIFKKIGTTNNERYTPREIGGLIGNSSGTILYCYSIGSISINESKDGEHIGGLVGYNDGNIENCYTMSSLHYIQAPGHSDIGGIAGENYGMGGASITNSYTVLTLDGSGINKVGGVIGHNLGTMQGCFFDTDIFPGVKAVVDGNSTGASGNTTIEMKQKNTFLAEDWDFVNSWGIIEDITYPWLYPLYRAPIIEKEHPDVALEDEEYIIDYEIIFSTYPSVNYLKEPKHETDAGWLNHDRSASKINGTPGNDDVGFYWLNLSVEDYVGESGRSELKIEVVNVNDPPIIVTENIFSIKEDETYSRYYYAIDIDPLLTELTWIMETNAKWLEFEGNHLYGKPLNNDIGEYWVNVTVFDREGDFGFTNFTLTVESANDAPVITMDPVTIAIEDELYTLNLTAIDEDINDELTWELLSGPSWLLFTRSQIRGTPGNDDIGTSWVRLKVTDLENASDELNFILEVKNTNDAPYWVEAPGDHSVKEGEKFTLNIMAEDMDFKDRVFYNITSDPDSEISIHPRTGLIQWDDPSPGTYTINVSAYDGRSWSYHEFIIDVKEADQNIMEGKIPYIAAIVVLILLLIAVLILFFLKDRSKDEGIEE